MAQELKENPPANERASLQEQVDRLSRENEQLRELVAAVADAPSSSGMTPPGIEGWYDLLLQNINDVIWLRDADLRLTYISPSIERITGYTQTESLELTFAERVTAESLEPTLDGFREAFGLADHDPHPAIETELRCKDGSTRWVESDVTVIRNPAGKPVGLLGVTRDIAERRRIREQLRERNLLLESVFGSLNQIFFTLDVSAMRIVEISPSCEAIYGISREAFLENPQSWFRPILEKDKEQVQAGFDALFAGTKANSVAEYRIRRPDGAVRWMHSSVQRRVQGERVFFDGSVNDITDRKRLEGQLQQSQKMEAIGTLAGGVAHDMNNVLGVVMGLGSVLQAQLGEDNPLRKHVDGILAVSRRGRDLTKNLLGFARKGQFRRETVVLNHLVEEVISLLGRTVDKSIVIRTRLDGALDPVEGDPGQLNHALMNLCLNGCDAMSSGGTLTISSRNVRLGEADAAELAPGRYARITITDTGEGMTPESVKRAFEPFYSTKPKGAGTGLGLSMVYGTIANHGGAVSLDSELGVGTTVTVHLPTIAGVAEAVSAERRPQSSPQLKQGTILLVDDEELFRFAAEQMLTSLGYEVVAVDGGAAAVEVMHDLRDEVRLVLLDLQMPDMDGAETFHKLRAVAPGVPVLLCSGFSVESKAEQLLEAGALGYLQKPFEVDALAVSIARALRRHRRARREST